MKAAHYAQALAGMDEKEAKVFADRLVTFLKARGRMAMLPSILSQYTRLSSTKHSRGTRVIVADEASAKKHAAAIKADCAALGVEHPVIEVDDSIVGGHIVRTKDAQIDRSYKNSLLKLYTRITTNA